MGSVTLRDFHRFGKLRLPISPGLILVFLPRILLFGPGPLLFPLLLFLLFNRSWLCRLFGLCRLCRNNRRRRCSGSSCCGRSLCRDPLVRYLPTTFLICWRWWKLRNVLLRDLMYSTRPRSSKIAPVPSNLALSPRVSTSRSSVVPMRRPPRAILPVLIRPLLLLPRHVIWRFEETFSAPRAAGHRDFKEHKLIKLITLLSKPSGNYG